MAKDDYTTPSEQLVKIVLLWPVEAFQWGGTPMAVMLALGGGVMYYMLGGQFSGQSGMQLAKAYLAAGVADGLYFYLMAPGLMDIKAPKK